MKIKYKVSVKVPHIAAGSLNMNSVVPRLLNILVTKKSRGVGIAWNLRPPIILLMVGCVAVIAVIASSPHKPSFPN
jgi:hypothetical protein